MNCLVITPSGVAPLTVKGRDTIVCTDKYYVGHCDTTDSETETFSKVKLCLCQIPKSHILGQRRFLKRSI